MKHIDGVVFSYDLSSEKLAELGSNYNTVYNAYDILKIYLTGRDGVLRKAGSEALLVVVNFDDIPATMDVTIPAHAFDYLNLKERKSVKVVDLLTGKEIKRTPQRDCYVSVDLEPLGAVIFKFKA